MTNPDDSLLQCLMTLCRFHGGGTTAAAVCAGLPLQDGRLTPDLFERAAARVGLASKIVYRNIADIEPALLPAVVLLNGERACLVTGWDDNGATARVVYPEHDEAMVNVPRERLLAGATGVVILCRPRFRFDARAPRIGVSSRGHWFWDAIRANAPIYRDVLLAAFFINLFALALPLFTMNVYDRVVPNQATETLWMLAAGVVIVLIADITLRTMRGYFLDLASRRVDIRLSALILERVLGIRLEHRPASVGSYAANLRSFETVRDFITSASITTIIDIPFALIFVIVIGWIAWPVLVPVILGLLLVVGYSLSVRGKLMELAETTYRAGAMRNATLIESLVGLETIKAMGAESRMQRRWEETTTFLAHVGVKLRLVSSSAINVTLWGQQAVAIFVIVTGVYLINNSYLSMGGLIACSMLAGRIMAPFGQLAGLITQYHNAQIALKSLEEVMAKPVERPEGTQFLSRGMFRGEIEFKNVSFSYPGAQLESLSDVSFKVKAGEHVAILGRVGSGKSTIQKLAIGLYQPTAGSILIDGIDLRQLDPSELRSRVGYVPQDVTLFYGSLRDNLTLSNPQVSDSALMRAVEIANLAEFVNRHPQGFDMVIGERGDSLSGGQRKSVALARGVLQESALLIMDEPTGSMDHSTEVAVQKQLAKLIEGRTWIVVTHRNSLLDMVDRIIVIDNGKLVADGLKDNVVQALQQGRIGKAQ
jgi:ATP-binding cassette subfamily C protein LapB